jgi:hypothetical protein
VLIIATRGSTIMVNHRTSCVRALRRVSASPRLPVQAPQPVTRSRYRYSQSLLTDGLGTTAGVLLGIAIPARQALRVHRMIDGVVGKRTRENRTRSTPCKSWRSKRCRCPLKALRESATLANRACIETDGGGCAPCGDSGPIDSSAGATWAGKCCPRRGCTGSLGW